MPHNDNLPMHFAASGQGFANARVLRQVSTETEKRFWEAVRGGKLDGLKFRRQHPIGPYIADFYCHLYKLVIELDGSVHDEDEQQAYDQNRDAWMQEYGIVVMRFSNEAITTDLESVKQQIMQLVATL
jgi:very-short-patch-repair endonuclease